MDTSIAIIGDNLRICADVGGSFNASRKKLLSGGVVDASRGSLALKVWMVGNEVYLLHVFSHDIRWPADVFVWELDEEFVGHQEPKKIISLYEFLAQGNGIPATPKV